MLYTALEEIRDVFTTVRIQIGLTDQYEYEDINPAGVKIETCGLNIDWYNLFIHRGFWLK